MLTAINHRTTNLACPPSPSRRALFGAGAALLTGGAVLATVDSAGADDGLVDLVRRLNQEWAITEAIDRAWDSQPPGITPESQENERQMTIAVDNWWNTVEQIIDTPARTTIGLRAKALAMRRVLECMVFDKLGQPKEEQLVDASSEVRLAWSLAADLRWAGGQHHERHHPGPAAA